MKMFAKLLLVAVLFTVLAGLAGAASAYSNIGLSLSKERLSGCPGFAVPVDLTITNNDVATHTYSLSLEMPQGWKAPDNGFIQPEAMLASGESQKITFWINPPAVTPGVYSIRVRAKTGMDEGSLSIETEVLRCHEVRIELQQAIEICADSEFQYAFSVTNSGKESEDFEVTASGSWGAELYNKTLKIDAGKKSNVTFQVVSPAQSEKITVKALSKSSYAKDEQYTQVNVKKCYDFQASVEPKEASSCLGTPSKFVLKIKNTGTAADVYIIQVPAWVVPGQGNTTILSGEEKSIDLLASPANKGKTPFEIVVASKGYGKLKTTLAASVEAKECKSVAVIVSPPKQEVCKGMRADFTVTVKNTGAVKDSYGLQANAGTLESGEVGLDVGEVKETRLSVDTKDMKIGENAITVTAKSGNITDQNAAQLVIKNCYSADFAVSPRTAGVCAGDEINYTITAKNTGLVADNYTMSLEGNEIGFVNLAPNESRMFAMRLETRGFEGEREHNLTLSLKSQYISREAVSSISLKPRDSCYKAEITSEGSASRVEPGKGIAIAVKIKNKGEKPDSYVLGLEGPAWVHLNQNNVSLKPGEETSVYVYASPGYDVAKSTYSAVLKARSESSGNQSFTFRIGVGVTPGPDAQTGKNETKVPTGAIIGVGGNAGKVILLALIVLLILVILVVKFVLFVK